MSEHAKNEARRDNLTVLEILMALLSGEMIEYYPEGYLGPSCLIFGQASGKPIHIVCGIIYNETEVTIRTVYSPPDPEKWMDDLKTRRK